jgi:exonuclease I
MKLSNIISVVLAFGLAVPLLAESSNPVASRESVHYSKAELAQLRKEAHTPEQYRALAVYFEYRKRSFQEQANQEKKEWERRSQNIVGPAAKYPRPVDSAHNLYEYYDYEADQAGVLQAQYQRLAESAGVATGVTN